LLSEAVTTRISRDFGGVAARTAGELLASYSDVEQERVHLAILDLSGGELDALRHYVERAQADFRDVLFWAHNEGFGDYLNSAGS
jgi:hypothetical protein